LHLREHALLRRIAPARVAPDLGLRAQALHGVVEYFEHELGIDDLVDDAACGEQVNLRLFHLNDGAAGVGERVQLFVERVAQSPDALANVLVVEVLHGERDELGRDGAELHGLARHALRGFVDLRVLHVAAADGAHDARHQARFDVVVENVAAREADAAAADRRHLRNAIEARHVKRRIARPALAADVLREAAVAVRHDVEAGDRLLIQIDGERVLVLLAEPRLDHRFEERFESEVLGVPARARQRARDRRRQ
jgi:hypothetical protein